MDLNTVEKDINSCWIGHWWIKEKWLRKLFENHNVWLILCFNPSHVRIFSWAFNTVSLFSILSWQVPGKRAIQRTGKHFSIHLFLNCRQRAEYNDSASLIFQLPLLRNIYAGMCFDKCVSIIHNHWVETEYLSVGMGIRVLGLYNSSIS